MEVMFGFFKTLLLNKTLKELQSLSNQEFSRQMESDTVYISNLATLDEKSVVVTSSRADKHFEEDIPILCAALDKLKLSTFPEFEVRVRQSMVLTIRLCL
ncbi:uncharacterized protein LOC113287133 isoform X2 [Papaver somniferum]|uniref:uncharacterized protein LOC113287133 isoform X2 n=1 Tax=Papaver somniferum TaxID=3469 RepID=UPI000E7050CC|nr:uncharacterized protein LOC113287133 isoform X2 [Papaver somniferum]